MDDGPAPTVPPPALRTRVAAAVGVCAVATVVAVAVAPIPTHTWAATAVTVVIGLVVAGMAMVGRPRRVGTHRPVRPRTVAPWVVVLGAVAALELGALAYGDRLAFPTVSYLAGPHFVDPAVRLAGYVVWISVGYWLVRR